jgi:hypothetical protein
VQGPRQVGRGIASAVAGRGRIDQPQLVQYRTEAGLVLVSENTIHSVDRRHGRGVQLGIAAGDQQQASRVLAPHRPDEAARLRIGLVSHRARVDHDDLGLRSVRLGLEASTGQLAFDRSPVELVQLAAQRNRVESALVHDRP